MNCTVKSGQPFIVWCVMPLFELFYKISLIGKYIYYLSVSLMVVASLPVILDCVNCCCRYNNQWTIVDYNKFVPGANVLQPDLIWVIEQIPLVPTLLFVIPLFRLYLDSNLYGISSNVYPFYREPFIM